MYTENNTSPTEKIAHDSQGTELLDLAQKRFGSLTDAEVKFFQAISNAEFADYSANAEEDNDPASSQEWGKERVLKADRIAWLCTDHKASALVTHMGIFVKGVRIEGHLNLQFVEITFPLTFTRSVFLGGINLLHAKISTLSLNGTHTGAIIADGIKVEGNVFLRHGFKAKGEVRLLIANIGGNLECDDAYFTNKGKIALNADGMKVKGSVYLRNNFLAKGSVRLVGATIGGDIECNGGHFINSGEEAILALGLNVKGNVYLGNDFHAEGEVNLAAATIGGYLNCDKGTFINEGGKALNAPGMKVESTVFLQNGFKSDGEVYLFGATIGGDLICYRGTFNSKGSSVKAFNAPGIKVRGSVLLNNGFKAIGEVCLRGATIAGYLQCDDSQFISSGNESKALTADQLKVGGSIFLSESFRAEGEVRLLGSTIGGDLECHGGMFINKGGQVINADGIKVSGGVFFSNGFKAEGEVRLIGATIGGDITCHNGTFINNGGKALSADGLRVEGSIFLDEGFKADGEIRLLSAIIGKQLNCIRGTFINKAGQALNADGIRVEGNVHLCSGFRAEGTVNLNNAKIKRAFFWTDIDSPTLARLDLRSARIGILVDESSSWPNSGSIFLHGLVYDEIDDSSPTDAETRLVWLRRQLNKPFRPQPYEQLATILRKEGNDDDANKILIAKNEDRARLKELTWSEWCWYRIFGPIIGYGYRPLRALRWILLFIVLGWYLFGIGFRANLMAPAKAAEYVSESKSIGHRVEKNYPTFCAPIYSLDMFVPLVNLHQANYWLPNADKGDEINMLKIWELKLTMRTGKLLIFYMWAHILLGWMLTTLFVVGLTGLIRT